MNRAPPGADVELAPVVGAVEIPVLTAIGRGEPTAPPPLVAVGVIVAVEVCVAPGVTVMVGAMPVGVSVGVGLAKTAELVGVAVGVTVAV